MTSFEYPNTCSDINQCIREMRNILLTLEDYSIREFDKAIKNAGGEIEGLFDECRGMNISMREAAEYQLSEVYEYIDELEDKINKLEDKIKDLEDDAD
jgi:chromosome segregation ATPase